MDTPVRKSLGPLHASRLEDIGIDLDTTGTPLSAQERAALHILATGIRARFETGHAHIDTAMDEVVERYTPAGRPDNWTPAYDLPISVLGLPRGIEFGLREQGMYTLGEAATRSDARIKDAERVGNVTLGHIKSGLKEHGLETGRHPPYTSPIRPVSNET